MALKTLSDPVLIKPSGYTAFLSLKKGAYFFLARKGNIYYKFSFDGGNIWSKPSLLATNVHSTFDVAFDEKENIYLTYTISQKFNLILLTDKEEQWTREIICPYSPAVGIPYYPRVLTVKGRIYILTSHVNTSLPGAWSIRCYLPKGYTCVSNILDYGTGLHYNYLSGVLSEENKLHLLYRFFTKDYYQLKYLCMNTAAEVMGRPVVITKSPSSKYAPCFHFAGRNLHVLYLHLTNNKLQLGTCSKTDEHWGKEKALSQEELKLAPPFLLSKGEDVYGVFLEKKGWCGINLQNGKAAAEEIAPVIKLFEKNGEDSFMGENNLFQEIKKEFENELRAVKKENQDYILQVSRLQGELEQAREEINRLREETKRLQEKINLFPEPNQFSEPSEETQEEAQTLQTPQSVDEGVKLAITPLVRIALCIDALIAKIASFFQKKKKPLN